MALEQIKYNIAAFEDSDAGGNNYFAGTIFEIFNTNDTLADIFSDAGGFNPINQDGIVNVSNSEGRCVFYIESGNYYIKVGSERDDLTVGIKGPLINDLTQVYEFPTVDLMSGSLIVFPVGKPIRVKEHTSTKGGGAKWDVVLASSGTVGAGFVLSSSPGLAFKLRVVEHMNVKQWGMFGGVNEDSTWQDIMNSGVVNIFLNRGITYEINSLFAIDGQVIKGNSCTFLVTGNNQVYTIANGEIRDITFDGNDDGHTAAPSNLLAGYGAVIDNVRYKNFHGKTTTQLYCLQWEMWGVHNFTINRCKFIDITHDDNGVIVGKGFVGAIRMSSTVLGADSDTSYGTVSNIRGENIYSVDAGAGVVQDSDMIRLFWDPVNGDISDMDWDIKFNKITAVNVGKRVFKTGGISGCSIKTVRCYKNDGLYDAMFSVVSLSGDSNRWDVSDVKGKGEFQRGVEVSGRDHSISHIGLTATTPILSGFQFGAVAFPCFRAICDNINLKGFAQSLYFYDSFDSQVTNYQSDSNLGINHNNTSGGNSNTVSNGVHKDAIIIDQGATLFVNNCRIEDYPVSSAYAFDVRSGNVRVRGLNITSNSARRMMNLALQSGQIADIDDVSLIRNVADGVVTNDHNIFSTLDCVIGSSLIIGKLRVVSNANPAGTAGTQDGNAHVLIKNVNYTGDLIEVKNNAARGTVGSDVRTSTPQGACRLGRLVTQQPVAGGSVLITNSTDDTYIGTAEIENNFANTFNAYLGTAVLRGSSLAGLPNTPTTITIP